jgi:hypothetical protein
MQRKDVNPVLCNRMPAKIMGVEEGTANRAAGKNKMTELRILIYWM